MANDDFGGAGGGGWGVAGLLPARMVNEFVYCPRLFFYEWVEGIFRESSDTVEGSQQHKRVDKEGKGLRRRKTCRRT